MEEIWKDIKGYEGRYIVSNFGRVKSLLYNKLLKQYKTGKSRNYLCVKLYDNFGNKKNYKVHRLVMDNFTEKIEGKNQVNHIDGNTFNNKISNLEWCDNSENQIHAYKNGLNKHSEKTHDIKLEIPIGICECNVPVVKFDFNYNKLEFYGGEKNNSGVNRNSIYKNCKMETYRAGNYKWRYIKDCTFNNKIIVISGKSCSGKNFILNYIKKQYNRNEMISTTNRPKRISEIHGIDYYFDKKENIINKAINSEFLELRKYDTKMGTWFYGIQINELNKENKICIVDLKGLKTLYNKLGKHNIISIYIEADYNIRKNRYTNRDEMTENNINEMNRRFKYDDIEFTKEEIKNNYDYIFYNNNENDFKYIKNKLKNIITNNKNDFIFPNKIGDREFEFNGKYYYRIVDFCNDYNLKYNNIQYILKTRNISIKKYIEQNKHKLLEEM